MHYLVQVVVVACLFAASNCSRTGDIPVELHSPSRRHTVLMASIAEAPTVPFIDHVTTVSVKSPDYHVGPWPLYRGDWFDQSFANRFSGHAWPTADSLRFIARYSEPSTSRLIVENQSGAALRCLHIDLDDVLLIFDMPPQSRQTWDVSTPLGGPAVSMGVDWCGGEAAISQSKNASFKRPRQRAAVTYSVVWDGRQLRFKAEQ